MNADHTDLEAQLRAAYNAQAQLVTAERLSTRALPTSGATHHSTQPSRRRSIAAPLLAAAAVIAIVTAAILVRVGLNDHRKAQPGTPRPTVHTSISVLQRGMQATRADIPWSQVGAGWTLAVWSPNANGSADQVPGTVFLVNPVGGRYEVTTLPAGQEIQLWSPNHQKMLLADTVFDLKTGTSTPIHLPDSEQMLSFTADSAGFIGTVSQSDSTGAVTAENLAHFDLTGKLLTTYPVSVSGAGKLATYGVPPLNMPDGHQLAVGAADGLVFLNLDGTAAHAVTALDSTGQPLACHPASFWSATIVLATCQAGGNGGTLWKFPTDGSTPEKFSADPSGNYLGFLDAWQTSAGVIGLSAAGCGPAYLVRFDTSMHAGPFTNSRPAGASTGQQRYIAHDGDTLTMMFKSGGCQSGVSTLGSTNSVTGASTALLGPGMNGGNVLEALSPTQEVVF